MMEICESNKKIIKAFLCLLLPRCESYGFAAVVESQQNHIQPQISTQMPKNPKFCSIRVSPRSHLTSEISAESHSTSDFLPKIPKYPMFEMKDHIKPQIFPKIPQIPQSFAVAESQQNHIQPQISSQMPKMFANPAWM